MECPYCHGELEPGNLSICYRDPTYWLPKGTKMVFHTKSKVERAGGLFLGPRSGESPDWEAWYCRNCKRLTVFDVK